MPKPHGLRDNIRAEMARRKLSQAALASILNLSQAAISRRLSGEIAFDVDELTAVAKWLDVPVSTLLGEDVAA